MNYPDSLKNLIAEFKSLPGIGPKSAERIGFYVLDSDTGKARRLADAIVRLKEKIRQCSQCYNLSENEMCSVCSDPKRSRDTICVVETAKDVQAVENTRRYNGLYHVLGGKISPLDGIGPDRLKIKELAERVQKQTPKEVIIATGADVESEATALYIARMLKNTGVKVTRIAYGIPVGSSLEFADEVTLMRSMEGRQIVGN